MWKAKDFLFLKTGTNNINIWKFQRDYKQYELQIVITFGYFCGEMRFFLHWKKKKLSNKEIFDNYCQSTKFQSRTWNKLRFSLIFDSITLSEIPLNSPQNWQKIKHIIFNKNKSLRPLPL